MTTMNITEFVNGEYFAHAGSALAVSTLDGYRKLWRKLGPYFEGRDLALRVVDCQGILRQVYADSPHLNRTTLSHIKNFLSGVWSHALRMGILDTDNPWRVASIPNAPEPNTTYAYSAQEIEAMLAALKPPYDLIVLFMAGTGLRKSEARGVKWGDFDAKTLTLSVERAVWRSTVKTTKNKSSKAPIPVIPELADRLVKFRGKAPASAYIFPDGNGNPLDFDNTARRKIIPALEKAGIKWHGYHAMRRGLATTLHSKGIADKEIQRLLRHSDVATTQRAYIQTLPENVRTAMSTVNFGNGVVPPL